MVVNILQECVASNGKNQLQTNGLQSKFIIVNYQIITQALAAVTKQENNARTANDDYCRNGHPREGNTYTRADGRRECYMCSRARDRIRYNTVNPRKP